MLPSGPSWAPSASSLTCQTLGPIDQGRNKTCSHSAACPPHVHGPGGCLRNDASQQPCVEAGGLADVDDQTRVKPRDHPWSVLSTHGQERDGIMDRAPSSHQGGRVGGECVILLDHLLLLLLCVGMDRQLWRASCSRPCNSARPNSLLESNGHRRPFQERPPGGPCAESRVSEIAETRRQRQPRRREGLSGPG